MKTFDLSKEAKKKIKIQNIRHKLLKGNQSDHLFTVNSISGGRTSAMMAVKHPADMNIFSLVTTDYPEFYIQDEAIRRYVWNKLDTDLVYATLESDETIRSVMELEQYIGKEIIVVCGESLDKIISDRNFLPNARARFCTSEMKIKPIYEFLKHGYRHYRGTPSVDRYESYLYALGTTFWKSDKPIVRMNIGYRLDDIERVSSFKETFKYPDSIHTEGRHKGNIKWRTHHWRIGNFPVIKNTQADVISYWEDKPVSFPEFNNCEFCFHRPIEQLQKQFRERPKKGKFWITMEQRYNATFRSDLSLQQIKDLPYTETLDFTAQNMCSSGSCTD